MAGRVAKSAQQITERAGRRPGAAANALALYLRSRRWGWRIDDRTQRAELDPPAIMPVGATSASAEFFAAAEAGNRMPVPDPQRGPDFRTMQLPTVASIAALNKQERISMWVRAAMDRYPNADDVHFGNLEDEDIGEFLRSGRISAFEGFGR